MQLDLHGQPLTEYFMPFTQQPARPFVVAGQDTRRQWTRPGPGERVHAVGVAGHLLPGHSRPPAPPALRVLFPGGPTAHARRGDERGDVAIALRVPRQKGGGLAVHIDLRADDEFQRRIAGPRRELRADDGAEVGGVGDGDAAVAERMRARDQRFGGRRSVTE